VASVVISACNVASYPDGGGHFWVYMQYAQGLRNLGVEVHWLERIRHGEGACSDSSALQRFYERMERYGLGGKAILYDCSESGDSYDFVNVSREEAHRIIREADLLLNFEYKIAPSLLACFSRTALVDIDPGLLQFWISTGQVRVHPHDLYFTIGETVGSANAKFPDCGLPWRRIRPPVCLDLWPYAFRPDSEAFTTVSHWHTADWIDDPELGLWENTKRVSFLDFVGLPEMTSQKLQLALHLKFAADDRKTLERHGWQIRDASAVARGPEKYRAYVQGSRGEFSCAKPSCMYFQNAWISDRSICYLASGKPVIVQNTGKSSYLPSGEGMFRFSTMEEAVDAIETVNANYQRHCRRARGLAESLFDSGPILEAMLNRALDTGAEQITPDSVAY
jgi:hypothetical protein